MSTWKKPLMRVFLMVKGFRKETLDLLNDTNLEQLADDYDFYKEVRGAAK